MYIPHIWPDSARLCVCACKRELHSVLSLRLHVTHSLEGWVIYINEELYLIEWPLSDVKLQKHSTFLTNTTPH